MREFEYIAWLRGRTPDHPRVPVGPGDDCAVVTTTGRPMLVTTDMLLEGSHFVLAEAGACRVGRKAMAVNLSDLAAMAGRPIAAVVSVGLPQGNSLAPQASEGGPLAPRADMGQLAQELYRGLREVADQFDTALAGGDTNSWPGKLVIAVTLFGEPGPGGPVLRNGARPGDWLLVTGPLGGSLLGKHLDFTPRLHEAQALAQLGPLHAMIDISDGLAADVNHICEESNCAAVLQADAIPISQAAKQMRDDRSPLEHALGDGEDFELAFAVAPDDGERLTRTQPIAGITLVHIGKFASGNGLTLIENGVARRLDPIGFVHRF